MLGDSSVVTIGFREIPHRESIRSSRISSFIEMHMNFCMILFMFLIRKLIPDTSLNFVMHASEYNMQISCR